MRVSYGYCFIMIIISSACVGFQMWGGVHADLDKQLGLGQPSKPQGNQAPLPPMAVGAATLLLYPP